METLSIKLETPFAKKVRWAITEFQYSTKTEFVRDAMRTKIKLLEDEAAKKKAWDALFAARGVFKGKGKAKTDDEFRALTEKAGEEFIGMLEKKFAQK